MPSPIRSETNIRMEILPVPTEQIWPILAVFDSIQARAEDQSQVNQYFQMNTRNWQITKRWSIDLINELVNIRRTLSQAINALFEAFGHGYKVVIENPVDITAVSEEEGAEGAEWTTIAHFWMDIVEPCTIRIMHTYRATNPAFGGTIRFRWTFRGGTKDTFYVVNDSLSLEMGILHDPTLAIVGAVEQAHVITYGEAGETSGASTRFQYTSFDVPKTEQSKVPVLQVVDIRLQAQVDALSVAPTPIPEIGGVTPEAEEFEQTYAQYVDGTIWVDVVKPVTVREDRDAEGTIR